MQVKDKIYARRAYHIKALGFTSYVDYLASQLWKTIRLRILMRDKFKCKRCGKGAHAVHHRSYCRAVLLGDYDEMLVALCEKCHTAIEFDGDTKLSGEEVQARDSRWFADKPGERRSATCHPRKATTHKLPITDKQFAKLRRACATLGIPSDGVIPSDLRRSQYKELMNRLQKRIRQKQQAARKVELKAESAKFI